MSERLPAPDLARIASTPLQTMAVPARTSAARIHFLGGAHPTGWNQHRHWGPTTARFDHHPPPPAMYAEYGIVYLTVGDRAVTTACAEVFQRADGAGVGPIDRTGRQPALTIFEMASDLVLLDLSTGWVTKAGGNGAICSGPRPPCRAWARAIHDTHGQTIDGIAFPFSVWPPGLNLAVWADAARVFPASPVIARDLADVRLDPWLESSAADLATYLVGNRPVLHLPSG